MVLKPRAVDSIETLVEGVEFEFNVESRYDLVWISWRNSNTEALKSSDNFDCKQCKNSEVICQ